MYYSFMPIVDLSIAVMVDLFVLVICSVILLYHRGLRASHPAVMYLGFHTLVISLRAVAINSGASTFFSDTPGMDGVQPGEIARAVLIADIALISATVGWTLAGKRSARGAESTHTHRHVSSYSEWVPDLRFRPFRLSYIHIVSAVAMPLGLLALAKYGSLPGYSATNSSASSYLTVAAAWPGLILLALIYFHGFRPALIIPMSAYLVFTSIQGYDRFRLIIPLLLLCLIYLDRHGRRWPGKAMLMFLSAALLMFFPLKAIGLGIQHGEGFPTISAQATSSIQDALTGRSKDQAVLDELAITISGTDESNEVLWGRPYLNVLVLPIPREWWPEKPGLADYLRVISRPNRPLAQIGGVTTLPGDLYLNFRIPGLILVMFLLARLSGRLYREAYRRPYLSVARFGFLLLVCNLIQIYRDGLMSLPVFLLVNMMPLMVMIALHLGVPKVRLGDLSIQSTNPPSPLTVDKGMM